METTDTTDTDTTRSEMTGQGNEEATTGSTGSEPTTSRRDGETSTGRRTIAVKLSTVLVGLVVAALVAAVAVFAGLYLSARNEISARDARAADDAHVEQLATDYAVGASTIDYRDVKSWQEKLKANTTPELAAKFDATAPQLEQILLPLQWTSKATPIASVVTSESDGIYKVTAFLNTSSTSAQTPDGGMTTVTYELTVDKNSGWKITDVGGLEGTLPVK